jgi:Ca2+-binding EF-hand superfamily protein
MLKSASGETGIRYYVWMWMFRAIKHLNEVLLLTTAMLLALPAFADLKLPIRLTDNRIVDNDDVGLSKTLEHNFSPEDRARLRKALSDYARNADPDHQLMVQKRKAMHDSISQRFNECNRDNDDSLDREEATLCLPQVARHFSYVDLDGNGVITLDELENAYAQMVERQRAAEAKSEAQQNIVSDSDTDAKLRNKSKLPSSVIPANSSASSTSKDASATRKRPS